MHRNFQNYKGFTLIEVLASIVLLTIVISISLSIFPNMFRTNDVNEESLDAVAVAKDVLVNIKDNSAGLYVSKTQFKKAINGDPAPVNDYFVWIEDYIPTTNPTPKYPGYRILIIIDDAEVKANPADATGLNLFKTTIQVFEGQNVRATNYGYVTRGDFLP